MYRNPDCGFARDIIDRFPFDGDETDIEFNNIDEILEYCRKVNEDLDD